MPCHACAWNWIGACMARKRRMHACALEPEDVLRPESLLPWLCVCVTGLGCLLIAITKKLISVFFYCVALVGSDDLAQSEVPVAPVAAGPVGWRERNFKKHVFYKKGFRRRMGTEIYWRAGGSYMLLIQLLLHKPSVSLSGIINCLIYIVINLSSKNGHKKMLH